MLVRICDYVGLDRFGNFVLDCCGYCLKWGYIVLIFSLMLVVALEVGFWSLIFIGTTLQQYLFHGSATALVLPGIIGVVVAGFLELRMLRRDKFWEDE